MQTKHPWLVPAILVMMVLLVGGAGCFLAIVNLNLAQQLRERETLLHLSAAKVRLLPELRREISAYKAGEGDSTAWVGKQPAAELVKPTELVKQIQQLAIQSDLQLDSCIMEPQNIPVADDGNYQINRWQVKMRGSYPNLRYWCGLLSKTTHMVAISGMRLKASPSLADDRREYELQIGLTLDVIEPREKVEQ